GRRVRACRRPLLPEARRVDPVHSGNRAPASRRAGPAGERDRSGAASRRRGRPARARRVIVALPLPDGGGRRRLRGGRLPAPQERPVPLAQPRLRRLRRVSRYVQLREAQEGAARAAAGGRGGYPLRARPRRRAFGGGLGSGLRVSLLYLPALRSAYGLAPGLPPCGL